jgi:hypothetical protein
MFCKDMQCIILHFQKHGGRVSVEWHCVGICKMWKTELRVLTMAVSTVAVLDHILPT